MNVEALVEAFLDTLLEARCFLPQYMIEANLNGACAIVSEALIYHLKTFGIEALFVVGSAFDLDDIDNHCWVELDGQIFDLTARQFDSSLPPILVTTVDDERYQARIKGPDALKSTCDTSGWPQGQSPATICVRFDADDMRVFWAKLQVNLASEPRTTFLKGKVSCSTQNTIA